MVLAGDRRALLLWPHAAAGNVAKVNIMEELIGIHGEDIDISEYRTVSKNTGAVTYQKVLVTDEETGMFVKLFLYPKGTITAPHRHNCAHGMYVLEGTLHTHRGDFGPGSFVWFKEGEVMTHGAQDEDVLCLFITNKTFDITYL